MTAIERSEFIKQIGAATGILAAGGPLLLGGCGPGDDTASGRSTMGGTTSTRIAPDILPSGEPHLPFPSDFLWGTATAAHQVEGGNTNNNWYAFEQGPGRIFEGHRSGDGCQWWEGRAEEDIERMVALNTNAHRLSIEWSRIVPEPGTWNPDAIARYREILTAMRDAGIAPMVTLHHFTNPLWMEQTGGWLNEEAAVWFQRFVRDAVRDLGDLCDTWCTVNEPNVYSAQGFFNGKFPPGHTSMGEYFQALHNLLLAHARAYHTIHELQPQARVGLAKHMIAWYPHNPWSPLSRWVTGSLDDMFNRITLNALKSGSWRPLFGKKGVIGGLSGTLDWMGLNYYQRYDAGFSLRALGSLGIEYAAREGMPKGPEGWGELYPDGLYESLDRFHRLFGVPIYITENGVPDETDEVRPGFLLRHLHRSWVAIQEGCPLKGYFFWSLVDNFEWAEGFDPRFRFGLYGMDFRTQERTLRRSGELFGEIAGTGGITRELAHRYAPEAAADIFGAAATL